MPFYVSCHELGIFGHICLLARAYGFFYDPASDLNVLSVLMGSWSGCLTPVSGLTVVKAQRLHSFELRKRVVSPMRRYVQESSENGEGTPEKK